MIQSSTTSKVMIWFSLRIAVRLQESFPLSIPKTWNAFLKYSVVVFFFSCQSPGKWENWTLLALFQLQNHGCLKDILYLREGLEGGENKDLLTHLWGRDPDGKSNLSSPCKAERVLLKACWVPQEKRVTLPWPSGSPWLFHLSSSKANTRLLAKEICLSEQVWVGPLFFCGGDWEVISFPTSLKRSTVVCISLHHKPPPGSLWAQFPFW